MTILKIDFCSINRFLTVEPDAKKLIYYVDLISLCRVFSANLVIQ